jgi:hypothetical protein
MNGLPNLIRGITNLQSFGSRTGTLIVIVEPSYFFA